jgi:hypothetical protein
MPLTWRRTLLTFPAAVAEVGRAARLRGVAGAAAEAELFVRPAGTDFFPDFNLYARAPIAAKGSMPVNTPAITAGREVDPEAADEVVMSEALASQLGVTVGDTVTLESMTSAWVDAAYNGGSDPGPPDGPRIKVVVVGLSRTPADFARWKGLLHLSPAFVTRYADKVAVYSRVEVRLSSGASRHMVSSELRGLAHDVEVSPPFFVDSSATEDGLGTIATSLRLVAVIAALAGGLVLALTTIRVIRLGIDDRRTLIVLGWTRRHVAGAALLVVVPWLVVGVGLGILAAWCWRRTRWSASRVTLIRHRQSWSSMSQSSRELQSRPSRWGSSWPRSRRAASRDARRIDCIALLVCSAFGTRSEARSRAAGERVAGRSSSWLRAPPAPLRRSWSVRRSIACRPTRCSRGRVPAA